MRIKNIGQRSIGYAKDANGDTISIMPAKNAKVEDVLGKQLMSMFPTELIDLDEKNTEDAPEVKVASKK
jgi:hypothetical protein